MKNWFATLDEVVVHTLEIEATSKWGRWEAAVVLEEDPVIGTTGDYVVLIHSCRNWAAQPWSSWRSRSIARKGDAIDVMQVAGSVWKDSEYIPASFTVSR